MKPWEDAADDLDDGEIEGLWGSTVASDFLFAIHKPGVICITPAVYFTNQNSCYDQYLQIGHLLPTYLKQRSESDFFYRCADTKVYSDLLAAGFCHSEAFQDFISSTLG